MKESFSLLLRSRFKGYRCKSNISLRLSINKTKSVKKKNMDTKILSLLTHKYINIEFQKGFKNLYISLYNFLQSVIVKKIPENSTKCANHEKED